MAEDLDSLLAGRTFTFIAGAEGSGTTLLLRLLSSPDTCCSLGGNYQKVPDSPAARDLATQFEQANRAAWNDTVSFAEHEQAIDAFAKSMARVLASREFDGQTHLFFKRSFPFGNKQSGRFTPDLWDLHDLLPRAKFIAIYRQPPAACYSALRRQFDNDLRRLAVACSWQLTWLAAQLRQLPPTQTRVVSYEALCESPEATLAPLADFCGIPAPSLRPAIEAERIDPSLNARYQRELDPRTLGWLKRFFDVRRRRQWSLLEPAPLKEI